MWLSDDIPIGQWEGIRRGPDKRINEKIPQFAGSFNDLPSTNERTNGETEQNTSEYAPGVLLEIYDLLGQISAAAGRGVQ